MIRFPRSLMLAGLLAFSASTASAQSPRHLAPPGLQDVAASSIGQIAYADPAVPRRIRLATTTLEVYVRNDSRGSRLDGGSVSVQFWSAKQQRWGSVHTFDGDLDPGQTVRLELRELGEFGDITEVRVRARGDNAKVTVHAYTSLGEVFEPPPPTPGSQGWLVASVPPLILAAHKLCCFGESCTVLPSGKICPFSTFTCQKKDGNTYSGCQCTSHCG